MFVLVGLEKKTAHHGKKMKQNSVWEVVCLFLRGSGHLLPELVLPAEAELQFLTACKYVVFWGARSGDRLDFSLGACPSAFPLCCPPRLFKYLPPCNISHVGFLHVHPHAKPSLLLDGPCIQLPTSFSLGKPRPELTATEVSEYSSKARHNHRVKTPHLHGSMG